MTVLLVEHDMEVVFRLAHRITVLHRGAVIADGAPDQVKADRARAGRLSRRPRLMLRIEGMNTHYGASHVLQGVDLDMPQGRISAVLGRNGVGKTTMVKTIMGLVVLSGGRVHVGGTDITGWPPHRVAREGVAYVPEGRLIFPDLTVIENIKVGERGPGTAWPLARLLELFPSLSERAASRGSQLSGGEQQMLAIARALVSDPKVMLLDEPSQGLAPLVVRELARVIRLLREEGVTILLVEQNMKLAEAVADELHIMVKGRMVYSATPGRLPRRGRDDPGALSYGVRATRHALPSLHLGAACLDHGSPLLPFQPDEVGELGRRHRPDEGALRHHRLGRLLGLEDRDGGGMDAVENGLGEHRPARQARTNCPRAPWAARPRSWSARRAAAPSGSCWLPPTALMAPDRMCGSSTETSRTTSWTCPASRSWTAGAAPR